MARSAPFPVICLGGPTGSGKTAIALSLARELGCEIINADSRQVYADFPIITAQPGAREINGVPHSLYGFLPTSQKINAGRWIQLALGEIAAILAKGKIPLLVGGTGLYFQALLRGIAAIPPISAEISGQVRTRLCAEGPEALHTELARLDPEYAARVHPHDRQRIARALEVALGTGKAFSWWHKNAMPKPLCAGPLVCLRASPTELLPRLARRMEEMLAAGAVDEARAALDKCAEAAAPGWSGIGCAELRQYLEGKLDLDECKNVWLANTRAYAKRQNTWFGQRREAVFFGPGQIDELVAYCQNSLPA